MWGDLNVSNVLMKISHWNPQFKREKYIASPYTHICINMLV